MKFLIDNALSPIIAKGLRDSGFEAVHVKDAGLHSASDSVIFEHAFNNDQIIISADAVFGTLLALRQYSRPSVILFRQTDKRPQSQLSLLLSHLSEIMDALIAGSIVVFEDQDSRLLVSLTPCQLTSCMPFSQEFTQFSNAVE